MNCKSNVLCSTAHKSANGRKVEMRHIFHPQRAKYYVKKVKKKNIYFEIYFGFLGVEFFKIIFGGFFPWLPQRNEDINIITKITPLETKGRGGLKKGSERGEGKGEGKGELKGEGVNKQKGREIIGWGNQRGKGGKNKSCFISVFELVV